jgi:hypothetical protein
MVFTSLVNENSKKTRIGGKEQQTSVESIDGVGGVMNEGDLEGWKM